MERKFGVPLPSDLKDYYLSTNGFQLTWSLEHAGDNLPIGEMNINPIAELVPLEALDALITSTKQNSSTNTAPEPSNLPTNFSKMELSQLRKLTGSAKKEEVCEMSNFSAYYAELRKTMVRNVNDCV